DVPAVCDRVVARAVFEVRTRGDGAPADGRQRVVVRRAAGLVLAAAVLPDRLGWLVGGLLDLVRGLRLVQTVRALGEFVRRLLVLATLEGLGFVLSKLRRSLRDRALALDGVGKCGAANSQQEANEDRMRDVPLDSCH